MIRGVPAIIPSQVITETPDEMARFMNITSARTLTVLTFGTRFKLLNEIIYPEGRQALLGQRLDLREELIAFQIKMVRGSDRSMGKNCDFHGFDFTKPGLECWKVYSSLPLCNVLAGAPIVNNDGSAIYGIIMNELLCEDDPLYDKTNVEPGFFELVRLGGPFPELDVNYIDKVRTHYEHFIDIRELSRDTAQNPQELFNFTEGLVDYEENFGPSALQEIKTKFSGGVQISGSVGFVITSFLGALFV
uniref:Uncharacterized protein n=3 Tax=Lygus hesperus TaxID=30085 RepID=A0A146LYF9_LYGHE